MADAIRAQIRRATLAAQGAVGDLDAQAREQLTALYEAAAARIAAAIRARANDAGSVVLAQLQDLLRQVEGHLQELATVRNGLLTGSLTVSATLGLEPFAATVGGAARMQIHDEALRFVRTFVASDGLQLSDRLWRLDRGAKDAVTHAIERAVIEGHGAAQAAREFLGRGEAVPGAVDGKLSAAGAEGMARASGAALLKEPGNALDHAMRVFRTEINRAHGEAYMRSGEQHPDFGGWRFMLSPAHPKPDICDLLSTQNAHGLGPGVYPSREKCPWPAHPNTLSFVEIVFADEVTAADRAGKETPLEALARLPEDRRAGVLGQGKAAIFEAGKLRQGMIRAPLAAVRKRVGVRP